MRKVIFILVAATISMCLYAQEKEPAVLNPVLQQLISNMVAVETGTLIRMETTMYFN